MALWNNGGPPFTANRDVYIPDFDWFGKVSEFALGLDGGQVLQRFKVDKTTRAIKYEDETDSSVTIVIEPLG